MVSITTKRITVGIIALILLALAIASLATQAGIVPIILNILVIILSIMGFLGAWWMHIGYLGYFMLLLTVLAALQIAFIIWRATTNMPAREFSWQIVEAAVLLIGAIFTADLRRAAKTGYASGTYGTTTPTSAI